MDAEKHTSLLEAYIAIMNNNMLTTSDKEDLITNTIREYYRIYPRSNIVVE